MTCNYGEYGGGYADYRCAEAAGTPRERLCAGNLDSMSDAELVALLFSGPHSSSNSERRVARALSNLKAAELGHCPVADLKIRFNLDDRRAMLLAAAIELGKRAGTVRQMCLTSPEHTMCYLSDMSSLSKEHFRSLCLNTKKCLLRMDTISIGDLSSSIAHPREIFYPAVQHLADSVIVAHNHPSGDPTPSAVDITLTNRLHKAGELLGIKLVDHIIVGAGCFVSLRREGVIRD